jgi:glucose/arabinose dehydrogenase
MPVRTPVLGREGADEIQGGPGAELLYGHDPASAPVEGIRATRVAEGLDQPVFAATPPDDPTRLLVVEKGGTIQVVDAATGERAERPFLDVSAEIATEGEQGLLGLALAPDFATSGRFFVDLTNRAGDTEIREYRAVPGATGPGSMGGADPASGRVLLTIDQPAGSTNHKGGWLGFGPDGHLHVATGDGGGAGDPFGNAQDPGSLLGKILRLDVSAGTEAEGYAIPADNPFAAGGALPEIWALGLRNPWRAGFDRGLGELWIGDVGQGSWEEVDRGVAGANYGWNLFEGPDRLAPGEPAVGGLTVGGLTVGGLTAPVHAYGRAEGQAITGGTPYRGGAEALQGEYLFADFGSGRLWSLATGADGAVAVTERTGQLEVDAGTIDGPVSFGEGAGGTLYLVDLDGEVFRLDPRGGPADLGDAIRAGAGDDMAFGGPGGDLLLGEEGDDELHGQTGDDRLDGGAGNDRLQGGPGNDAFVLAPGGGQDVVLDLEPGDRIALAGGPMPTAFADGRDAVLALDDGTSLRFPGMPLGGLGSDLFV